MEMGRRDLVELDHHYYHFIGCIVGGPWGQFIFARINSGMFVSSRRSVAENWWLREANIHCISQIPFTISLEITFFITIEKLPGIQQKSSRKPSEKLQKLKG